MRLRLLLPSLTLLLLSADVSANITGTVFRDINQNGAQNSPEPGVAGVAVRAYSSANVLVNQTTSAANGTYTLVTGPGNYRIEYGALSFLDPAGGTNSSSVRFAVDGATVNLALANPSQYCEAGTFQGQTLPRVQVAQFTAGQRVLSSSLRALATFPYNITPIVPEAAESADLDAVTGDMGAVWAVAHHRRSNYLMAASFVRRHAELGPGRGAGTTNTGVIYVVDPGTNQVLANGSKVFADINQIAGSNVAGVNPRPNPVAAGYDFFHDPGNGNTSLTGTDLFRAIGRTGLGGIDLSEDGNTLYVVSLGDRRLYQLDASILNSRPALSAPLTTPVVTAFMNPSVAIPTGICANPADSRPFASKFYDGFLYIGVTCTGESTVPLLAGNVLAGTTSRGDLTQLRAVVWRFNPATQLFDNAPGMPTNPVLNVSLNYPRGCIAPVLWGNSLPTQSVANAGGACAPPANAIDRRGIWQAWQPNWQVIFNDVSPPGNIQNDPLYIEYPQPWLTDMEIDGVGALILGLRDLNGDKVGYCSGSPNVAEGAPAVSPGIANCDGSLGTHRGNGEGDILRACGTATAGWTLEANGVCGGVTANNPRPTIGGTAPQNGQGPGTPGGEFYWGDSGPSGLDNETVALQGLGYVTTQNGHGEIGMGGLALIPNPNFNLTAGSPGNYVVNSVIDARGYYDGGLIWFNNATGQSAKRIRAYDENILTGGKSGGLGDLEMMCVQAPVQVGNRVWTDTNGNGIQDGGETGINTVTVEIWSTGNLLLGRTTTDANGEWYINFTVGASDGNNTDANIIRPNPYDTAYRVYLPQSQTGAAGTTTGATGTLANLTATAPTADGTTDGTIRDSNGTALFDPDGVGGQAPRVGANFTLGGMGKTNHTLDFGFRPITGTNVNPGITIDDGQLQCGNSPRTYTVIITNPAAGSAAFTALPFGLAHPVNISPTSWTCVGAGGASCSALNGAGNPAGSLTITMPINSTATIQVLVAEAPACTNISGNVVLQATIPQRWATFQDTNMSNNFDDDIDVPTGDLSILLAEPSGLFCPGQTSTFTITVSNAGPATAENVVINMPLGDPPYNPGLTSWSRTGGTGTLISGASGITPALSSVITLLAGQSVIYTIQGYVRSSYNEPTLTQTATLTVPAGFTDTSAPNNSAQRVLNFCNSPPVSTSFCASPGVEGVPAAPISGVVNSYRAGTATTPAAGTAAGGTGCSAGTVRIAVAAQAGAAVNLAVGDLLMIIQNQNATIDSADSANYGDGTAADTNNAGGASNFQNVGRYEYVRAAVANATAGTTALCINGAGANAGLLNQYFQDTAVSPRRTFQVVRVPQYSNVTISDSTALTATAWDGLRGGIVVLDVRNQLSFNNAGSINVSGLGFRGAPGTQRASAGGGTISSFRNVLGTACHNDKGEGLAGTPSTITGFGVDYPNGSFARGAPGNAGGGGNLGTCGTSNNDEGGGGGGAACGDGGFGGRREAGGGGTDNARGRGAGNFDDALTDAQLMRNRLIMGGGGGAGQRDSATTRGGGNGGGIVILRAGSIVGVGSINVTGAAGTTGGSDTDGAGGGGGGGTVLIYTNPAGPANMAGITVNTNGGAGGDTTSGTARGSGGGGGAGCFFTSAISGQLPGTITTAAGAAGAYGGATSANRANPGEAGRSANTLPAVDNTPGAQPGYVCGDSLVPVTLGRVAFGDIGAGRVQAQFTTAAQTGTLGFNIYGVAFEGRRLRLNQKPLMADESSSLTAVDYQLDFDALGLTEFMIEEITTRGNGVFYGPYRLANEYGARPQVRNVEWNAIRAEVEIARSARQTQLQRGLGGIDAVEVRIAADGIYRIDHAQLSALGLNWDGTSINQIGLRLDDTAVNVRRLGGSVFGPGSAIEFYGKAINDSLYTRTQVYQLRRDTPSANALQLAALPGEEILNDRAAGFSRLDQDRYYGIDSPQADPWYYDRLTRAGGTPVQRDYAVPLTDYVSGGKEQVRVVLWGGLDYPGGVADHSVSLLVNGQVVGNVMFDGLVERELQYELPSGLLLPGANTVSLRLDANTAFETDRINISLIEIQHARHLQAHTQRLNFAARDTAPVGTPSAEVLYASGFEIGAGSACSVATDRACVAYKVSGFTQNAQVYRQRQDQIELLAGVYESSELRFAASEQRGDHYWIMESAAIDANLQFAAAADPGLLQGPVDYLAIAHPLFVEGEGRIALDRLMNRRAAEGLLGKVVDIEQLYRRYSSGRIDPEAVRQYIADAAAQMGVRYVLIVGGDSYDYFDSLGLGSVSFVPSLYRRTHDFVNFAPVDSLYVDLDADGVSDLPIGRLPVRGAAELNVLIDKIERIEQSSYLRTSVHVADRVGSTDSVSFKHISENFRNSLSESWQSSAPSSVYLDDYATGAAGISSARASLVQALGGGQMLTTYVGHSAPSLWSRERLLDGAMVQGGVLQNALRPTTLVQFGCWGAYYAVPQYNTMAHALLLGTTGGAAMIGSSGLTATQSDELLALALMPRLTGSDARLGDILNEAKREVRVRNAAAVDVILGTQLLGDPAMRINPNR